MIFVRILDRLVMGEFLKVLAIALVALTSISIMVHLMDHVDVFLDHEATWGEVAFYYLHETPYNLLLTLPMALLVATILTIGDMGRHGELTAMKSSGISLYRVAAPIVIFGAVTSVTSLVLGETVVPDMVARSNAIYEEAILGREAPTENYRGSFVYQNPEGYTYLVRGLFVEDSASSAEQVEVQRTYVGGGFLRINAPRMLWEPATRTWVLRDGELRYFPGAVDTADAAGDTTADAAADTGPPPAPDERMFDFEILRSGHLDDPPQELLAEERDPEEMGYVDLADYIEERDRLGADTRTERVDLHMKLAYPFANLIIVLFGVGLVGSAAHAGRQSATVGFGFALFLTIVYWGFLRVSQGIGYGGGLPPLYAAWIANGIFGAVGIVLLARART